MVIRHSPCSIRCWVANRAPLKLSDTTAAIIESGNMLLVGDRLIDTREWLSYTQRFIAAGKAVLTAAEQKKPDGVLAAGGDLNETCDACHDKYQRR